MNLEIYSRTCCLCETRLDFTEDQENDALHEHLMLGHTKEELVRAIIGYTHGAIEPFSMRFVKPSGTI